MLFLFQAQSGSARPGIIHLDLRAGGRRAARRARRRLRPVPQCRRSAAPAPRCSHLVIRHHQRALPRPPRPPLPHPPCSSPPPSPTARREHVPVLGAPETGVRNACAGPGALDRLDRPECAGPDHRTGVSVTAASPRPRTGPHSRERRSACTNLLHYPLTDRLKCTIAPVGVKRPAKDKEKTPFPPPRTAAKRILIRRS